MIYSNDLFEIKKETSRSFVKLRMFICSERILLYGYLDWWKVVGSPHVGAFRRQIALGIVG